MHASKKPSRKNRVPERIRPLIQYIASPHSLRLAVLLVLGVTTAMLAMTRLMDYWRWGLSPGSVARVMSARDYVVIYSIGLVLYLALMAAQWYADLPRDDSGES